MNFSENHVWLLQFKQQKKSSSAHCSQKQQLSLRSEGAKGNPVDEIFHHQKGKSEVWVYFGYNKVYKKHISAII